MPPVPHGGHLAEARRRWITGLVIFLAAYAVLLVAYFNDGRNAFDGPTDEAPPAGGVLVTMEFTGTDPLARSMTASVQVDLDFVLTDDDAAGAQLDTPKDALTVIVAPTADAAPLTYPAGQPITLRQIRSDRERRRHPRLAVRRLPNLGGGFHRGCELSISANRHVLQRFGARLACHGRTG